MAKINNLVTRSILKEELTKELKKTKIELRVEFKKLHNEVIEKLDSIVGMFKKFDEEYKIKELRV